ncbi:helix-turn-helix domain-containing protein [Desulfobacca acetoxidans]
MKLYTVAEVAEILKVHINTVRRLLKSRKLESIRVGNQYRISEEQLNSYLKVHSLSDKKQGEATPRAQEA